MPPVKTWWRVAAVIAAAITLVFLWRQSGTMPTLTRAADARSLAPGPCASGCAAQLEGRVTHVDSEGFALQDNSGSIWVEWPAYRVRYGWLVRVDGLVRRHYGISPVVEARRVEKLGQQQPNVTPTTLAAISAGDHDDELVEIRALAVHLARSTSSMVGLEVKDDRHGAVAMIPEAAENDLRPFVGSAVRVQGVVRNRYTLSGKLLQTVLRVQDGANDVQSLSEPKSSEQNLATLTKVSEIDALPGGQVPPHPVRLTADVTFYDAARLLLFVSDGTGGVYVTVHAGLPSELAAGQKVELTGVARMGRFAPGVGESKIRILGKGKRPRAVPLPQDQPISPDLDSEWVRVDAHVRSVVRDGKAIRIGAIAGRQRLRLHLDWSSEAPLPRHWIDARVSAEGVYGVISNNSRQITGAQILIPNPDLLVLRKPAPDESLIPITPTKSVLEHSLTSLSDKRIRVAGTAVGIQRQIVYIQDEAGGIAANLVDTPTIKVGDFVVASGFLDLNSRPTIEDAQLVRLAAADAQPRQIVDQDLPTENCQSQLISIEGRLIEHTRSLGGHTWLLQAGKHLLRTR
ncbi:MAG TPA: hypothetical protein VEQ63_03535, partial [Bryobacteraceae bacterium]|nr:hypothetical protein [Bryobacteraceae bacterium]